MAKPALWRSPPKGPYNSSMRTGVLGLFILSTIFLSSLSWAATLGFEDAVFPELATSGRALAMGNAFLSRVDDSLSSFYNPAGLGSVRHPHLHLSNFHLESNKGWMNAGSSGSMTDAATNFPKTFTLDGTRELLLKHPDTLTHARVQFMPNFTTRYFTMGYLISKINRGYMGTDVTSTGTYEYASRLDYGPYAGINLSMFGGVFKVGASVIYLSRDEAIGTATPTATLDLKDNDYKKGRAFIITGGTKLTLPFVMLPTFSATMHNALGTKFSGRAGGAPETIKSSVDLGFSLTPQVSKETRIHFEIDYKDVAGEYSGVSMNRKILAGMEFDFSRTMFVRFGYGDGFGSAGLGIKTRKLEFDLTTYAVDTTASAFRGREDRRFAMTLSSGF